MWYLLFFSLSTNPMKRQKQAKQRTDPFVKYCLCRLRLINHITLCHRVPLLSKPHCCMGETFLQSLWTGALLFMLSQLHIHHPACIKAGVLNIPSLSHMWNYIVIQPSKLFFYSINFKLFNTNLNYTSICSWNFKKQFYFF